MPNGQIAQYGGAVSIGAINSFVKQTTPLFPAAKIPNDQLINLVLVGTDLLGAQFLRPQPMLADFVRGASLFAAGSMTQVLLERIMPPKVTPPAGFRAAYSTVPAPALQVRQAAMASAPARRPAVLEM